MLEQRDSTAVQTAQSTAIHPSGLHARPRKVFTGDSIGGRRRSTQIQGAVFDGEKHLTTWSTLKRAERHASGTPVVEAVRFGVGFRVWRGASFVEVATEAEALTERRRVVRCASCSVVLISMDFVMGKRNACGSPLCWLCGASGDDYWRGFNDGAQDMNVIAQPIKTNGHTESVYCEIRARAEGHYYAFEPTAYQRGYCDGADEVALCVRGDVAQLAVVRAMRCGCGAVLDAADFKRGARDYNGGLVCYDCYSRLCEDAAVEDAASEFDGEPFAGLTALCGGEECGDVIHF